MPEHKRKLKTLWGKEKPVRLRGGKRGEGRSQRGSLFKDGSPQEEAVSCSPSANRRRGAPVPAGVTPIADCGPQTDPRELLHPLQAHPGAGEQLWDAASPSLPGGRNRAPEVPGSAHKEGRSPAPLPSPHPTSVSVEDKGEARWHLAVEAHAALLRGAGQSRPLGVQCPRAIP